MMASMPAGLTAATGMDALTHAIEGYTTKGAWELSGMFHLKAIELISKNLRDSVNEAKAGKLGSGREGMALGQYIAGMGFSSVGLGIDHAMAHTLSAHYDTPHGVACAMLLPIVMESNKPVAAKRLADVAVAMGVDTEWILNQRLMLLLRWYVSFRSMSVFLQLARALLRRILISLHLMRCPMPASRETPVTRATRKW